MSLDELVIGEIAALERDAVLVEQAGDKKGADRLRRDIARLRRQAERAESKRAVADERLRCMVRDFVDDLERRFGTI
jgi:hypothetical protein